MAGAAVALVGCRADSDDDGSITVFAAASLSDAFVDVARAFEDANPGRSVELNFAGSSTLREQILQGAPADVYASANVANMDVLVDADAVDDSLEFATNSLQIVVPVENPAGVHGLADFADADLVLGLCAEDVPCGDFGREALALAGVTPAPDTNEPDVRALLTKVEAGELDAAIVYTTDVISAGVGVRGIDVPDDQNVVATYPIATVEGSDESDVADAFIAFVRGDDGQAILRAHGFGNP